MVSLYVHSLGPERKGDCVCIWQQGTNPCSLTSLDPIATCLSISCPMLPPHSYLRQLELGQQLPFSWVWTSSYPGSHVGRLLGQVVELQTVERKLCQDTAHLATPSPSSSFWKYWPLVSFFSPWDLVCFMVFLGFNKSTLSLTLLVLTNFLLC